jgi:nucleotide-binding universal stress UspA family protein
MYNQILVPIDVADVTLAQKAIAAATELAQVSGGSVRLLNVMALTPVMLAEYVPPDFEGQQRTAAEETLTKVVAGVALAPGRVSSAVRQGGIYHEILEEAETCGADLIVMSSHRPAMRTYFLGSNAGHVVRYAKCSVLVVRGEQQADRKTAAEPPAA